jgi:hypothetical protein
MLFANYHPSVAYHHPFRWRTLCRMFLPHPLSRLFPKGLDCERVHAEHHWYNIDGSHSACYHCSVVRSGQLWNAD